MQGEAVTSPPPRRRHRRVILAAVAGCCLLAAYGVWWLSSQRALSYTGTGSLNPYGLAVIQPLEASDYFPSSDAPPSFGWHRGGQVFAAFVFHNSLSVPITITGVDHALPSQTWLLSGPQLREPRPSASEADRPGQSQPVASVHIDSGQEVEIDLLWRAADPCAGQAVAGSPGESWTSVQSIRVHYQVLPFLTQTQTVAIAAPLDQPVDGSPAAAFDVAAPTRSQCPAGYPHPVNTRKRIR